MLSLPRVMYIKLIVYDLLLSKIPNKMKACHVFIFQISTSNLNSGYSPCPWLVAPWVHSGRVCWSGMQMAWATWLGVVGRMVIGKSHTMVSMSKVLGARHST